MCAASAGSHFSSSGKGSSKNNANDTFSRMQPVDLSSYAPNGSNSSPMRPVYAPATGGSTEEFMAIANGSTYQPQLTPSDSPVSGPANPLVAAKMANTAAAAGDSGLFPIQEVEAQAAGKEFDTAFGDGGSKKTGVIVAVIVIVVVAIFAAAFFFVSSQEAATAKQELNDAVETLTSTDTVISAIDSAVAERISTGTTPESLSLALEKSTTTQNSLSSAETSATEALNNASRLTEDEQDAANAVLSSVSARRSMLEAARQIQTASTSTSGATEVLQQVYELSSQANSKIAYANELLTSYYSGGDISWLNAQDIPDNEKSAYDDIQNALTLVRDAATTYTSVDFSDMETYLNAFADQVNAMWTRDSAAVSGDTDTANAQADWYNSATDTRTNAKANVPDTAEQYVASHGPTDASVDAYVSNYAYAREKLVAADATVSSYASTSSAVSGELPEAQEQTSEEATAEEGSEATSEGEAVTEEQSTEEQAAEEQSTEEQAA